MNLSLLEVTAVLSRTPGTLRALLEGLPEDWLEANEGPDTFSPRDVLGHLIHGEKTDWVPRTRLILEGGEPKTFERFDRFGFQEALRGHSTPEVLEEFEALRTKNLAHLQGLSLSPTQMALTARHPELGLVTLEQLLATWTVHDLNHIGQIVRVLGKKHSDTVGPWKRFLGILND